MATWASILATQALEVVVQVVAMETGKKGMSGRAVTSRYCRVARSLKLLSIFFSRMWSCKPTETKRLGKQLQKRVIVRFAKKKLFHFLHLILTRYKLQFQKESKKELAESRERAHNPIEVSQPLPWMFHWKFLDILFLWACYFSKSNPNHLSCRE